MSITFPNVPFAKGVPVIGRSPQLNYVAQSYLGVVESFLLDQLFPAAKWGLYTNEGEQLIDVDNIVSLSYKSEARVSNFQVENGKFASYNKVATPYTAVLRMTKGGSITERANVLEKIDSISKSTDLYTIITPEGSYVRANVVSYDFNRVNNLLTVDVYIQEVREVTPQYTRVSNAADAASASSQSNGISQATTATSKQVSAFEKYTTTATNYLSDANTAVSNYFKNLF